MSNEHISDAFLTKIETIEEEISKCHELGHMRAIL